MEAKKMNIWRRQRENSGVSRIEIANAMGISEQKLKEVEENTREMPRGRMDEYIKTVNDLSKKDRTIRMAQAKMWYEQADFKKLMYEFNIKTQLELAEKLNCSPSALCRWLQHKGAVGTNAILKLYYFFNDEFNKVAVSSLSVEKKNVDYVNLQTWWKNFDLRAAIKETGLDTQKDFSKKIGIDERLVSNWCIGKRTPRYENMQALYDFFNNGKTEVAEDNEPNELEIEPVEEVETTSYVENDFPIEIPNEDEIGTLREEVKTLRKQVSRYETLIDMVIERRQRVSFSENQH